MALRPVLRTCAVTTLAAALTAATAFPAIASPIVPPSAPDPARNAVGQQVASEVKGEEQQTLAVDGIDPEALQPADQDAMPSADPSARTSGTPAPEPSAEPTVGPSAGPSVEPSVEPSVAAESGQPTPQAAGTRSARVSQASVVSLASAVKAAPGKGRPTGQERDVVPVPEGIAAKATAETDAETAPEARELAGTALPAEDTEQVAALTAPAETIDFIVAGVTWEVQDADEVTEVSVRVREDGTWTDWSSLEIHDGDERPGADRTGTEPLVSTGADAVQARVSTVSGEVPKGLQVDIINPGVADTDGKLNPAPAGAPETGEPTADHASATASSTAEFVPAMHQQDGLITGTATGQTVATSADVLKPAIVTRAQWGANESVVQDWGRPSTRLKALYIHHTAGSNNYTKAGAYAQIRGIFTYHAVNLQWGDIGYQFLVDKFGTIYQGRRGSIDAPVPGAQAGGFNTDTIGVSAMGNYDVVAAPAAMVTAIERVLAWQAYRYDVDPKGTTRLTQSGKGTARWSSGTTVTVPTILGHKVTNFTACPGRYLDAQIPTIRRKVDAAVKAAVDQHGDVPSTPPPGEVRAEKQQWSRGRLSVWWTRPAGVVDQYEVMRRTAPAGTSDYGAWTTVKWIDASKYTSGIFDVEPGTTAHFAVRAHNAGGTSELITVATHTHVSVQAPGNVRPSKQQWSNGQLSVWWTRPARVDRYEVMRRSAPAGTSDYGAWTTVSWLDASKQTSGRFAVDQGTTAQFAVRAHNAGGTSELITVATHTRANPVPGRVNAVKKKWVNDKLSIWWTRPAGVERYEVLRRVAPAGTTKYGGWHAVKWVDASKYTSGTFAVNQGTTAQFAVRAHNSNGHSPLTVVATHTRANPVPGRVSAVKKKWVNDKLSIWWTRPAGVERYEVLRRVAPAGTTKYGGWHAVKWVDASKYTSGTFAVNQGTTAQFAVRAHNSNGHSPLTVVATHTRLAR